MKKISSPLGRHIQNQFQKLFFNDLPIEFKSDIIQNFCNQTGLNVDEAEIELSTLNPFFVIMITSIQENGDNEAETISIIY